MGSLADQIVMPSGATTHRLDEHLRVPAGEALKQGVVKVGRRMESRLLGLRPLADEEAQVLVLKAAGANVRGAVSLTEKIRVRHHSIARLLAAGRTKADISRVVGVSPATLTILERSPAFQALVLEYMNMMDKAAVEAHTRLKILGNLGIDELTERLAESPKAIKTAEVLEIVKVAADRTGMGPTSKQVTLNGRISPADLRAIKAAQGSTPTQAGGEDHLGGDGGEASVCEEFEILADTEDGENVREVAGQILTPADEMHDLVADLGEIFGSAR